MMAASTTSTCVSCAVFKRVLSKYLCVCCKRGPKDERDDKVNTGNLSGNEVNVTCCGGKTVNVQEPKSYTGESHLVKMTDILNSGLDHYGRDTQELAYERTTFL